MPIYEYACAKCESDFEVEQRITEDPLKTCPRCRSRRVKRLISQTSFALKGGGWYADGYSNKSGEKSTGDKAESSSSEASSSGSASEGSSSGSSSEGSSSSSAKDGAKSGEKSDSKATGKKAVA